MKTLTSPSQGCILISEPFLPDQYFSRTIVLMVEHGDGGSLGIIMNRVSDISLSQVLTSKSVSLPAAFDKPVFLGGPVHQDRMYYLCKKQIGSESNSKIIDGIYWGGNMDLAYQCIQSGEITPQDIRFYVGYSSWEPNQLSRELKENTWIISKAEVGCLFNNAPHFLWNTIVKKLESKHAEWANYPLDPSLN